MAARINGWHVLLAVLLLPVAIGVYWYYSTHHTFRFRLTMEIEADGKVHTGSSVIEVTYYESRAPQTRRWVTSHRGVTPIVDLGPHGTLMASFRYNAVAYRKHLAALGMPVGAMGTGLPKSIDDLPIAAYNLVPEQLHSSLGQIEVGRNFLPPLIWLPRGGHWSSAKIIVPEEMPGTIERSVRFMRITLEPAPWATLVTKIEPRPDWLKEMLAHYKGVAAVPADQLNFQPTYIESEFLR